MTTDKQIAKENKNSFFVHTLQQTKPLLFGTKWRTFLTLFFVVILGFFGWKTFTQSTSSPQYQTAQVTKRTIIASVSESGNISTNSQGGIGSPTTGVVEALYVKDGDTVTVGQNLFKVKSTATSQEIASAYASLLAAQNTLNSAQAKMNSLQEALFVANQAFVTDRGVANPSVGQMADPKYIEENAAWLQAQADYTNQQGVINAAQAGLNSASLAYQATQDSLVTSPISGTIANISVQVGSQVTASSGNLTSELASSANTASGTTVLTVGDFSRPTIKIQASEVDIPKIKTGQKATITLNAFPGKTFVGQVQGVDTVGTVTSGVVTYNIYVAFLAAPEEIEPGMSATVNIQTARKDDVLTVPSAAIQNTGTSPTVRVLQNGQIQQVPVTIGISSDTDTEITSGLSEGQSVVTGISTTASGTSASSPFSATRGFGGFGGGGAVFRSGGSGAGGARGQ